MPTEFFHQQRLTRLVSELAEQRYFNNTSLSTFDCFEDDGEVGRRAPEATDHCGTMTIGDRWVGRDKYLWLCQQIKVPSQWQGEQVVGLFDFGTTCLWHNSGFESLLYVNDQPYQGVDQNHQEVLFDAAAGTKLDLRFRLWSGLEGGGEPVDQRHEILRAELACLNRDCDDFYYTSYAALNAFDTLDDTAPEKALLLAALNQAFQKIDYSQPRSEEFYVSISHALTFLKEKLEELHRDHAVTMTCVGHTHIDVAWLWRLKHTREKSARSFSTVNRLMKYFDDYTFLQSQPQLYDYIRQDYPDIFETIQQRVKEGKWEPGGAMWVEADCNLSSGESLVRQIIYGIRFFEQEFGVKNNYLWLPDVFGYSWALPQILKQCDLSTFITTKISWNEINRLPHDTFKWRGIDGTEVTAHFITTPNDEDPNTWYYTYNGHIETQAVQKSWKNYSDKGINQNLLLAFGFGDGGGGVNRHMLEMRRRLEKMPGVPKTIPGRVEDYVNDLNKNIEKDHGGYVHTWDGELYLEFHRGTYTSQAYNKRMNRKMELKYRDTEFLCVLDAIAKKDWQLYPQQAIYDGWKIIMRNQFHDIIPGSSIREVYEDCRVEYAEAEAIADTCLKNTFTSMMDNSDSQQLTVFNSASWQRDGMVKLPVKGFKGSVTDERGELLPVQAEADQLLVALKELPAMGASLITLSEQPAPEPVSPFVVSERKIETPFYTLEWNKQGQVCRLFDREARREVLPESALANQLQVFEDKPRQYDAWELEPTINLKQELVNELVNAEVVSHGPLQVTVKFSWQYRNSTIDQLMTLYKDCRRIDFATRINWQEREKLLKTSFPVDVRSTEATYDIQFGNVKRPTHRNTSWDHAKFEVVGHQWADLSEQGYGVALLNDCKYGYDIHNNVMRLTLLKSSNFPDPQADLGEHVFTYALLPHSGDWREAGVVQEAWDLNAPLHAQKGISPMAGKSLFRCDNANVLIETIKKAEDSDQLIVRLREFTGSRGGFTLESDLTIQRWQACNLLEKGTAGSQTTSMITDSVKPYEIKTYLVDLTV